MWQNEESNLPRISKQNVPPHSIMFPPDTLEFFLPVLYRTHLEPAGLQKLGKLKEPQV
jgi:hypothetical protein